jgi:bla regulator protein blaR1
MSPALILSLAVKSLLVAGAALLILHLARHRSAADRSAIAHGGLSALLLLPIGALLLPPFEIESSVVPAGSSTPAVMEVTRSASEVAPTVAPFPLSNSGAVAIPAMDWSLYLYAIPAVLLLLLTLAALLRLWPLKSRAQVIVDPHWLSALAHAQRRMGMKSGTALLASRDLHSPISWGLMRPVILLNDEALTATAEAEAIIAHELAHVSRFDWLKLLLARVATALFWFNPLVWLLAREAHQLREEAADDAVLAADVESTEYAQLLVGIARHECRGLLIGAHGVAPGRDSLKRRVKRVLDTTLARTPASRPWLAGFACGALAAATPLAALTLVPTDMKDPPETVGRPIGERIASASAGSPVRAGPAATAATSPRRPLANEAGAQVVAPLAALSASHPSPSSTTRRNHGVDPDVDVDVDVDVDDAVDDLVAMKAVGVTPGLVEELRAAGYGKAGSEEIVAAALHGVDGAYIRAIRAQGIRASLEQMVEMRVIGITPAYVAALRRRGVTSLTPARLIEYHVVGISPEDVPRKR